MATKKELQDKIAEYKKYSVNKSMPESARKKFLAMITPLEKELAEIKDEEPKNVNRGVYVDSKDGKFIVMSRRTSENQISKPLSDELFSTRKDAQDFIDGLNSGKAKNKTNPKFKKGDKVVEKHVGNESITQKNPTLYTVLSPEFNEETNIFEYKLKSPSGDVVTFNESELLHARFGTPSTKKSSTSDPVLIIRKLIDTLTDIGIDLEGEDETSIAATRMELEESDNDTEAVDEIIKDYEENWLTDLAKKPQAEVKKAFADYYKAIGGLSKKPAKKSSPETFRDLDYNEVERYAQKEGLNIDDSEENYKEAAQALFKKKYAKKASSSKEANAEKWNLENNKKRLAELKKQKANAEKELADDFIETKGGSGRTKKQIMADYDEHIAEYENKIKPKASTKKASTSKEAYDCDDLIAKEIERKAKRNESAAKTEKKPAITKNIEAVEKVVERAEKQFKDGDLTKAQIIKMIAELHARIKDLEKLLKTAK